MKKIDKSIIEMRGIMVLSTDDKKSLTELNYIIKNIHKDLSNKIPDQLKENIQNEMDKNYKLNIDITKSIYNQEYLPKTKALLSLIYSEYLCSNEEKEKWRKFDEDYFYLAGNTNFSNIKKNNIFEQQHIDKEKVIANEKNLIVYKTPIFKRIILYIKNIFKKGKK